MTAPRHDALPGRSAPGKGSQRLGAAALLALAATALALLGASPAERLAAVPEVAGPPPGPYRVADLRENPEEHTARLLEQLNLIRGRHRLPPLELSQELCAVADFHARDMAWRKYFSHASPEGEGVADRARRIAPTLLLVDPRENLNQLKARPPGSMEKRVEDAYAALMDSPGHRANILNPVSTHVGFGVASTGRFDEIEEYTVQVFGVDAGHWSIAPPKSLSPPAALAVAPADPRAEFFLFNDAEPNRRYPDPEQRNKFWLGGARLLFERAEGASSGVLRFPADFPPGRATLCVRLGGGRVDYEALHLWIAER